MLASKGYTLIEILIVVAIVGILVSIAAPMLGAHDATQPVQTMRSK